MAASYYCLVGIGPGAYSNPISNFYQLNIINIWAINDHQIYFRNIGLTYQRPLIIDREPFRDFLSHNLRSLSDIRFHKSDIGHRASHSNFWNCSHFQLSHIYPHRPCKRFLHIECILRWHTTSLSTCNVPCSLCIFLSGISNNHQSFSRNLYL